ncbi:fatty-acid--CoA ligase FadD5 [Rhodococcus aerolatus]
MTTLQERPTPTREPAPEPDLARRNHWVAHVARHAHERPDHPALRCRGVSTTYAQLHDRAARLASALARRGVSRGDRVALVTTNRSEFVEVLLAVTRLGAISVPVNARLTPPEVRHVLDDSGAGVVVTETALLPLVTAARTGGTVLCVADGGAVGAGAEVQDHGVQDHEVQDYEAALAEPGEPAPAVDVPEDGPALIMYTSGTTGHPKGAVLTHLNLLSQSFTVLSAWRVPGADTVNLCAAPVFHIAAVGCIAPLLLAGGTTVIHPTGGFDATDLLDTLERERITTLFLVPAQWQVVCADPTVASRDLRLQVISWGAAPASDTLLRRMSEVFPDALNVAVFGQTECSPITCALDGADALRKVGSVGLPVPSVSVRVVDEQMRDVPAGQVGEIVYRGPNLMLGYWQDPEATAEAFRGGWFHSGDLVRRDVEGFVYVVDRLKDMIISGGENIYCTEVENAVAAHPGVAEVAVIGRPDPRYGEVPVAVVAATPAGAPDAAGLREFLTGTLARYKHPAAVVVVDALPRNAGGKVVKGELRARHAG